MKKIVIGIDLGGIAGKTTGVCVIESTLRNNTPWKPQTNFNTEGKYFKVAVF